MNTQTARTLGAIAFANGIACAPVADRGFMDSTTALSHPERMACMYAWIVGWTEANIAA